MFKRFTFTLMVLSIASTGIFAQKMNKAQRAMDALNYIEAISLYNQILEKNDNAEAKINISECYRKVGDSENAEYWYGQVVRLPEAEPIHKLYYGQMLQRNGKCDLAKEWYENYVSDVPDDLRGQYLVKACDYEDELMTKNAGVYQINNLDFNSNLDDMSPTIFGDGVVFASERDKGVAVKRTHAWTGNPFLELYYLDAEPVNRDECGEYTFGNPKKFSDDLNSKYHDAAVTFSKDGKQLFFTRNNYKDGKTGKSDDGVIKLKVFSATKKGDNKWGDLEGLPFNSDEYSVAHPTLTPGGEILYFSSDMPGGFGGMDIYVSEKEGGRWGPPLNLGPSINTEGHEIFPYYDERGRLYFSSDGQIGLGGLDIYYMDDRGEGEWGPIENMGYPVNTISDDFGVVFDESGVCGFFTSDRDGGKGRDDIYSFKKISSPVEILVYDKDTKEPIDSAAVVNECTGNTLYTNAEGKVTIDMKMNQCCNFIANKAEYTENSEEGCTKDIEVGEKVFVEIPLDKEMMFELVGAVFDLDSGLTLEGATVTLTNDCDDEIQTVTTDETGAYKFELKEDCCYTVKGEKDGYIAASVGDQCTRGETASLTLQANLNLQPITVTSADITRNPLPEGEGVHTVNEQDSPIYRDPLTDLWMDSRTNLPADGTHNGFTYKDGKLVDGEPSVVTQNDPFRKSPAQQDPGQPVAYLLHIYYDFDQSYIRDEAEPDLNKLLNMLTDNPEFIVEIGSHTDSRGSYHYNRGLSQRRADAVVRWLVKKGIDRNRLVAIGYGETRNVNDCKNNVPCSEREHQLNRRTEFRILGTTTDDIRLYSQPKADPRIDECMGCPF